MLLDTNIFLEVALGQEHADACASLLLGVHEGEVHALITDFQVDSILTVLENYGNDGPQLRSVIASLIALKGLEIYTLTMYDRMKATGFMEEYRLDFDDSCVYQAMLSNEIEELYSYDSHFDPVPGITRIEP